MRGTALTVGLACRLRVLGDVARNQRLRLFDARLLARGMVSAVNPSRSAIVGTRIMGRLH